MINSPALDELARFNANPTTKNASRLVEIPSLYGVLRLSNNVDSFPPELLDLCVWLHGRASEVLNAIISYNRGSGGGTPEVSVNADLNSDWRKVS